MRSGRLFRSKSNARVQGNNARLTVRNEGHGNLNMAASQTTYFRRNDGVLFFTTCSSTCTKNQAGSRTLNDQCWLYLLLETCS